MEQKKIRLLRAEEIECRIGMIGEKGLSLLLYMDARAAQNILDETFTPFGWCRTHQEIGGRLYCTIEVWDNENQRLVSKQDVGVESFSEKEKGAASDSFKRACFNWGVGRELYSAPFIWIPAEKVEIWHDGKRYVTSDRFTVASIQYNEKREITGLEIRNKENKTVFQKDPVLENPTEAAKKQLTAKMQKDMEKELDRTGVCLETVLKRYHLEDISQMMPEHYRDAMKGLKRSQSRTAA